MVDLKNRKRHPDYLGTYLFEEGEWNKHFATKPIKIAKDRFTVDKEVERRLITWVQVEDAWGGHPPAYWTSFEYREIEPDISKDVSC